MKVLLAMSVAAVTALSLPSAAKAEPFSQLVAFSGALTDTGNYAAERGAYPPPFDQNRTSNGPLAVEVLASRLGLKAEPSLHLQGRTGGGTNFAVVDALAGGHGAHDLPNQVAAHLDRQGGNADPKALYFLFIGGNDVVLAATTPDEQKAEEILDNAVDGIETAFRALVATGAKTIMVPDFIDVGMAPAVRTMGPGPQAWATRVSDSFNQKFGAMLDRVQGEGGFDLIRWSFSDFTESVAARGEEFGFTNMTDSCIALLAAGKCDFDRFVFFNEQYPTAKVHELMGTAMALAVLQRGRDRPAGTASATAPQ